MLSGLPIGLGQSRTAIRKTLGVPEKTGADFDSFYHYGLFVDYDDSNSVIAISAGQALSVSRFQGRIFGLAINDPLSECIRLWGNPDAWYETPVEYWLIIYEFQDYEIELEVWSDSGIDSSFGRYEQGMVKDIEIRRYPKEY